VKHTEERKKEMRLKNQYIGFFYIGLTHCCVQLAACSVGTYKHNAYHKVLASLAMPANEPAQVPRLLSSVECTMLAASAFVHHLLQKTLHGMLTPAH
jgi:hypothetical protein